MNKQLLIITALSSVLFFYSCSKEKSIDSTDPDAPGLPGNTNSGLLVKTVSNFGLDSVVTTFSYDDQKRLTRQVIVSPDDFINEEYEIARTSDGHIQQVIYKSDEYADLDIESVSYNVFYNGATSNYTHKILEFEDAGGTSHKDSTAYTYDGQNRIIREEKFIYNSSNNTYLNSGFIDFSYDGNGEMSEVKIYSFDPSVNDFKLASELSYEYDDKVSPLALGTEAIVLELYHLWSSHNPTVEAVAYPDNPAENTSAMASYTYNDKNKPLVATITESNTGVSFTNTYYYQ
jgi:hypothetical protein